MGDKKFTFIELHLDGDTQFGPRSLPAALGIGGGSTEETDMAEGTDVTDVTEEDDEAGAAEEGDGRGAVGVVVALLVLAGIAFAVKKLRGGEEEDVTEREEPDIIVN